MNNRQKFIAVLFVLVVAAGAYFYVAHSFSALQAELDSQLELVETELYSMAEDVYRSRAVDGVSAYVSDCTPQVRGQFDNYLDRLNQLSTAQLAEMKILFEACASYFADSKQASVAKLEDQYEKYASLAGFYKVIYPRHRTFVLAPDWEVFITQEKELAKLLDAQLPLQKDIINFLAEGAAPSDERIRTKMNQARELGESASVLNRQIDAVYERLKDAS